MTDKPKILVIEHRRFDREAAVKALRKGGFGPDTYEIVEETSLLAGLAFAQTDPLIIGVTTALVNPDDHTCHMRGSDFLEHMRRSPHKRLQYLPIIIHSAGAQETVGHHGALDHYSAWVRKYDELHKLAPTMRELLQRSRAAQQ